MAAQQHSHVPKFGNWDSDNVPYTTYFENARKEKGSGVRMNPNDPQENPDAFMSGGGGHESYNIPHAVRTSPIRITSNKTMPSAKHHIEEHPNRGHGHTRHNSHQINILDQQKRGNRKSIHSESGSDKSNSDHSLLQKKNHRRARSEQNKNLGEGSNSFSPSVPQPTRLRSGNHPSDNISHRAASVPKFGAWDETDPKSGEGFTIIFNKVKEEKQIGAANFLTVPPQPNIYPNGQKSHGSSSSEPKICCCLFSRGNK